MKLLVAVSDKPYDDPSLDAVARLATDSDVTVLHAGDAASPPAAVTRIVARLQSVGARVTSVVTSGDAADAIIERARQESSDLVVVRGHDRHPGLLRRVFGDTVEKVVESCDRPVLALRGGVAPKDHRVLLAAGRPSPRMLDLASELSRSTESGITLVHVEAAADDNIFSGGGQTTLQRPATEDRTTQRNLEALQQRGADVEVRYREGLVERELVEEANSGAYWLMVVRARPVGFLHRLVLGHSFTEDLVRHVGTSVLILR